MVSSYAGVIAFCTSRLTFEELLFQLRLCDLDLHGLVHLLRMAASMICVILDRCREECVDEGSFSQTRFASNLLLLVTYHTERRF